METIYGASLLIFGLYWSYRAVNFLRVKKSLSHFPKAYGHWAHPNSIPDVLSRVFRKPEDYYVTIHRQLEEYDVPVMAISSFFPSRGNHLGSIYIKDAELIKEVLVDNKKDYPKPIEVYTILDHFGSNIVTTEGEQWKKHRNLCNPAFGDQNLQLVFQKTVENIYKVFRKWDNLGAKEGVEIDVFCDTTKLALAVISEAGFAKEFHLFSEDVKPEGNHKMTFARSFEVVSENCLWKLIIPNFAYLLPIERLQNIKTAFSEFEDYILELINQEKKGGTEDDLLSKLLDANRGENSLLSNREIIGDTFMFLLAGHETTANTLAFAIGLLAFNPDKQQKLYEEAVSILSDHEPSYSDYKKLIYTLCIFKETLRLFPPVVSIPKETDKETKVGGYTVPEKTLVNLQIYSLHRNPKHWKDPHKFIPERFDSRISPPIVPGSYFPFSGGPRNCIGQYFALVEGTIALALIAKNYTISVPIGITEEELLKTANKITLRPVNGIKVLLKKRM